jgi:hypothetical protein
MKMSRGPNKKVDPKNWWSPIGIQFTIHHLYWLPEDYSEKQEIMMLHALIRHDVRPYLVILPNTSKNYYIKMTTSPDKYFALKTEMERRWVTYRKIQMMDDVPCNAVPMFRDIPLPSGRDE